MKPCIPLSRTLHYISFYTTEKLESLHNINIFRLKCLIAEDDGTHVDEYNLILNMCLHYRKHKKIYLIAVEYIIDDGGREQGKGDVLLYDGETLYVVECKCTCKNPFYTQKRENDVRMQANKYVDRLTSWIKHLKHIDTTMTKPNTIIGAVLTEKSKKLVTSCSNQCLAEPLHLTTKFFLFAL